MNREAIEKRRADLLAQLQQQQQAQANAARLIDTVNGALQDCNFWLEQIAQAEKEAARPALELVPEPIAQEA